MRNEGSPIGNITGPGTDGPQYSGYSSSSNEDKGHGELSQRFAAVLAAVIIIFATDTIFFIFQALSGFALSGA